MTYTCKGKWRASAFPYIIAQGIFIFEYYVFVFRFAWSLLAHSDYVYAVISLILFHFTFIMTQVSFFQVTYSDPGGIPEGFPEEYETHSVDSEGDSAAIFSLTIETNKKGERRKCEKCNKEKPDRSHHCSICKRCILKMDHHCPWVNNCVGFYNYKFFVLFLVWTSATALVVAGCLLIKTIGFFQQSADSDIFVVACFIISLVFGLGLAMFGITHIAYLLKNQTTIEALEKASKRKENPWNLGRGENWRQVFGTVPHLWFVPVYTSLGNGLWYPQKQAASEVNSLIA